MQREMPELIPVGKHECVTCRRCATTFAAVHPECPACILRARCYGCGKWWSMPVRLAQGECRRRWIANICWDCEPEGW